MNRNLLGIELIKLI